MSDQEERELWRKAAEESPEIVKWIQALLRQEKLLSKTEYQVPEFTRTYSEIAFLSPYQTVSLTVCLPRMEQRFGGFQIVGMSIFTNLDASEMAKNTSRVTIHTSYADLMYEHPFRVLAVVEREPPFRPSWITRIKVPDATSITAQIENASLASATYRFAVHGFFEGELGLNITK